MEAILYTYLIIGFLFSFYFSFSKIKKVDSAAVHTSLGFRLIILPGLIILWPLIITIKKIEHL